MASGSIAAVSLSVLKRLSLAASNGSLDYATLAAQARNLGLTVPQLVAGIEAAMTTAEVAKGGAAAGYARQVFSAIKLLPEGARLVAEASRLGAVATTTSELATAQAGRSVVVRGATWIGTRLGLRGAAATLVGGSVGVIGLIGAVWLVWEAGAALMGGGSVTAEPAEAIVDNDAVPHPCGNRDIPVDAEWRWYQRIQGGGRSVNYERRGFICLNNGYYTYGGAFTAYSCDRDWLNCRRSADPPRVISSVKHHDDGGANYYYGNDTSWGWRDPVR
ncbi:hypothetical protein P1J78_10260 [Psychromarinibacter sp. C21-152]|uniref:Uncharacterized protein n=1 Tax=Psychromarinibacter sediminicola TaxID=3033385 RepID=A0AAE3NNA1_9RHOB|nr:hypothetical protein [Psychromarinibacter sediminicola]MDF0601113.1 hypothetical protein [Psychromarinibacter sediminicola]